MVPPDLHNREPVHISIPLSGGSARGYDRGVWSPFRFGPGVRWPAGVTETDRRSPSRGVVDARDARGGPGFVRAHGAGKKGMQFTLFFVVVGGEAVS